MEPRFARDAGLIEKEIYTVSYTSIGDSISFYTLEGFPGSFNTVMFDWVK